MGFSGRTSVIGRIPVCAQSRRQEFEQKEAIPSFALLPSVQILFYPSVIDQVLDCERCRLEPGNLASVLPREISRLHAP
jgi:hypothetical protein